jgi:lysyl-tRNA synthetase, class II
MSIPFIEENDQTRVRREHLEELRKLVGNVYPNKFERSRVTGNEDTIKAVAQKFKEYEPDKEGERPSQNALEYANSELNQVKVRVSGRISSPPRVMGKAAFVHLSDGVSRLQIYVRKADVKGIHNDDGAPIEEGWELFNLLDHGDFIGVGGYLFVTKTGELSIHVETLQFLSKAMLPMPDKMHGIADPEIRQRQRYADLIAGSLKVEVGEEANDTASRELSSREVFERRSKIIRELRRFLDDHGYIEVETPMLTAKATGAIARPFVTHHNALGIDLYARIAPELYLKRLLVGGFERVYELNRNFRNEGIDRTHNPEFTMLEFYCAYMDVNGMMDFCEELLRTAVQKVIGTTSFRHDEHEIDFTKFQRLTMKEAIAEYWPEEIKTLNAHRITVSDFDDPAQVETAYWFLLELENYLNELTERHKWKALEDYRQNPNALEYSLVKTEDDVLANYPLKFLRLLATADEKDALWNRSQKRTASLLEKEGQPSPSNTAIKIQELFERLVEPHLVQPTFITDFPKPVSPLSKASPADSTIAERFELFIGGLECANGFSELNDPKEQYERFVEQAEQRERGDEEAMVLDEDYIRALSYGMPPAAGIGIGIDRLVMLLTNKRSIRDVILFPHMRPERKTEDAHEEAGEEN